jgi:thymidylate synthase
MNKLDLDYQNLLRDILENGVEKDTRNGKTLSVFGRQIRHDMKLGFPLLTTKKMAWKTIVTELLWFLNGNTNIKYLVDNNCHIWDGDAYQAYVSSKAHPLDGKFGDTSVRKFNHMYPYEPILPKEEFINKIKTDDKFADEYGDLGPVYGAQWRRWSKYSVSEVTFKSGLYSAWRSEVDQISKVINQLKTNPDDRGIMVSAWNVSDLDDMVLRPCHYSFQFYTRELSNEERVQYLFYKTDLSKLYLIQPTEEQLNKENIPTRAISLMWNQRSCDFPLGIPANIMSYALLLMMIAKQVNMVPDELIGNLGDCHIYLNQIEGVKEQLTREPYTLPSVKLSDKIVNDLSEYTYQDIILENYQSHPKIYFPLSN